MRRPRTSPSPSWTKATIEPLLPALVPAGTRTASLLHPGTIICERRCSSRLSRLVGLFKVRSATSARARRTSFARNAASVNVRWMRSHSKLLIRTRECWIPVPLPQPIFLDPCKRLARGSRASTRYRRFRRMPCNNKCSPGRWPAPATRRSRHAQLLSHLVRRLDDPKFCLAFAVDMLAKPVARARNPTQPEPR